MQTNRVLRSYKPNHALNRMGHEGDVENARKIYTESKNRNLLHLLRNRFIWMNSYISHGDSGIELGAGIGASKDFIDTKSLLLTDFLDSSWLDLKNIDALKTGFKSAQFDFVIASNMLHHLAFPHIFLEECFRILKPGGRIIIQEIETSFFMRLVLKIMRHEGFDESINVFDQSQVCNEIGDPWSANCAIPKLLFGSHKLFEINFPHWKIIHDEKVEFFQFLNSGGVVAKTFYIPLNLPLLKMQDKLDRLLCRLGPNIFPLQRQIVLVRS